MSDHIDGSELEALLENVDLDNAKIYIEQDGSRLTIIAHNLRRDWTTGVVTITFEVQA